MYFIVPLFVFLRLGRPAALRPGGLLVDVLVVLLTASRIFVAVIPVSGHSLFLTYSGMTVPARWFRLIAVLMFVHACAVKVFMWGDFMTLGLGIAVGWVAARLWRRANEAEISCETG
jgi:hypothetical protein